MSGEFINPNWHVILIHYPIGLLTAGVLVELVSLGWREPTFRAAGRWMILLGAVLSIPTAVAGIYAFRDVVLAGPVQPHMHWYQVVESSGWEEEKWRYITRHLWLNSAATAIFLLVSGLWVVLSERWRVKLYWPLLILLIAGVGTMSVGAWYGGEAVYELGTAVNPKGGRGNETASAGHAHAGSGEAGGHEHDGEAASDGAGEEEKSLTYYLPPLQLHVVLVGFVFALTFVALAVALHRTERTPPDLRRHQWPGLRPAWFWLAGAAVAFGVVVAGVWATNGGEWSAEAFRQNFRLLGNSDYTRLLVHLLAGGMILLLLLLTGLAAWKRPWNTALSLSLATLLCLSLFAQLWLGVLMLYDSRRGPLFGFASAAVTEEGANREEQPEKEEKRAESADDATTSPEAAETTGPSQAQETTETAEGETGKTGTAQEQEPEEQGPAAVVKMTDSLKFEPRSVTIQAGETIEWRNEPSSLMHTVTAAPSLATDQSHVELPEGAEPFDSGQLQPGQVFRHKFPIAGSYKYFCIPHEAAGMIGEVQVEEK